MESGRGGGAGRAGRRPPPERDCVAHGDGGVTAVEPLNAAAATRALLACARVVSLRTPEHAKATLALAATLGAGVPVYRMTIPTLSRPALPEPILRVVEDPLGGSL